jgi:hypothetical protein
VDQRHDHDERGVVDHLDARHQQADVRHDPADRVGEDQEQQEPEHRVEDALADPPADQQAGQRHDHQRDDVVDDVGGGAADQHGGPRHRQRPEPVDDALLHVVGEAVAGERRAEDDGLGEDAGDQELLVVDVAGRVDGAAEHVGEEQHEHDRADQDEHQDVGHPLDLDQVALGDDPPVGQRLHCGAHLGAPDRLFAGGAKRGR